MAVILQHKRGDIALAGNAADGQLFWSFVNKDAFLSEGHSYSEGQLWIKDPSNDKFLEIANRHKLHAANFVGFIGAFDGDFVNADESLFPEFRHCQIGDFWIFDKNVKEGFNYEFVQGDILLITDVEYEEVEDQAFRHSLKNVKYIRIPGTRVNKELSDLDAEDLATAILELEARLLYNGTVTSQKDFYNLTRKKGYCYVVNGSFYVSRQRFNEVDLDTRITEDENHIELYNGDFVVWTGENWRLIKSGTPDYKPNTDEISAVSTFTDSHKQLLSSAKDYSDAIHKLNISKAQLDEKGKVPYEQLPESVRNGLSLQGKFYPVNVRSNYNYNTKEGQNDWPEFPEGYEVSGYFWIVDCQGYTNVQYIDKTQPDRILELNSGDFIVWVESTKQFEVIDNSDRITSFNVKLEGSDTFSTFTGNIQLASDGGIQLKTINNGETIFLDSSGLLRQTLNQGKKNYVAKYQDDKTLTISEMYEEPDTFVTNIGFTVGSVTNEQLLKTFGDLGVYKTAGNTKTTYINNFMFIETAHTLNENNDVFYRTTRLRASERNNFAEDHEAIDIYYPEASSTLLGVFKDDVLSINYYTKTAFDGFLTDTLTSEWNIEDPYLEENYEQGYSNIGIGRTVVEDTDLGEITFYAKSKDRSLGYPGQLGFYTKLHSFVNPDSFNASQYEHFLNRDASARTHLVINPNVLMDELETFVRMPLESGTLITWEEVEYLMSETGIPLMIPAWEIKQFRDRSVIGLDTSPITIRLNRDKVLHTSTPRENDLSLKYGPGLKSTWSYIGTSQEGSLQEPERTSKDNVVNFDAWLEAQRAIASKEAFILPASAKKDGKSIFDPETGEYTKDDREITLDNYGQNGSGGIYQRILPSRSIYEDESVYFEPVTGKLKPQQVRKDIELPAEGGVLLTSRSRIDGGVWIPKT